MTKLELLERLKNEGFPEVYYNLEGGDYDERLCLERKNNRWFVYLKGLEKKKRISF